MITYPKTNRRRIASAILFALLISILSFPAASAQCVNGKVSARFECATIMKCAYANFQLAGEQWYCYPEFSPVAAGLVLIGAGVIAWLVRRRIKQQDE